VLDWPPMQSIKSSSFSNGKPLSKATNPRARKRGDESTCTQPAREQITSLARQLYIESGCEEGRDAENWLRAEQILRQQEVEQADSPGTQSARQPKEGAALRSSRQRW
jgi:hypothetical protein